jgi:hypothetical protein
MSIEEDFLHQEMHQTLQNWALRNAVHDDHIVASLLEDLQNEENLSIWATLDPFEFLPRPTFNIGSKYAMWAKYASILRNIAVFVPVALTWKAVSEATTAFGKFVEANSASTVNFLVFWQNGYDVLSKFWTIGHVASLDFLIILGVILLSLGTSYLTQVSQTLRVKQSELVEQDRLEIALALKVYLYALREIDKGNIKEGIATSVSSLQSATNALTKTSIELKMVMAGLQNSIPVINDFGTKMQKETKKLNDQVTLLTDNLADINSSIVVELRDAVNSASAGLALANDELNESTASIRKNALDAEREIKSFQGLIRRVSKQGK